MIRGIAPSKPEYVAGVELGQWMRAYRHTHDEGKVVAWPDGGCYAEQLSITVELWELIDDEIGRRKNAKR